MKLYLRLGDKDQVFASLDKAYDEHDEGLLRLKVDPRYDSLRSDPHFTALLRRVGSLRPLLDRKLTVIESYPRT